MTDDMEDFSDVNFGDIDESELELPEEPEPKQQVVKVEAVPVRSEIINVDIIKQNIKAQGEILDALVKFIFPKLIPGQDYYSIKEGQKPSLGKSGAEKINFPFRLIPKYSLLSEIVSEREVRYVIECRLFNKITTEFSGSGLGSCSSQEEKYAFLWKFDKDIPKEYDINELDFIIRKSAKGTDYKLYKIPIPNHINMGNTILKMAKKRAYVDATLSATMASFLFTQDIEDMEEEYLLSKRKKAAPSMKNTGTTGTPQYAKKPTVINSKAQKPQSDTKPLPRQPVQEKNSFTLQELDPDKFKILNKNSKYYGSVLSDCPTWYLQGQFDWVDQGKYDPSKYGYDIEAYKAMIVEAINLRAERKLFDENGG